MFSTSNKLIRVDFPEGLSRVYTAGDTVKGTVNLTLASAQSKMNGEQKALKMASVVAKLRVLQVSTYYRTRGASNNSRGEFESNSTSIGRKRGGEANGSSSIWFDSLKTEGRVETVRLVCSLSCVFRFLVETDQLAFPFFSTLTTKLCGKLEPNLFQTRISLLPQSSSLFTSSYLQSSSVYLLASKEVQEEAVLWVIK